MCGWGSFTVDLLLGVVECGTQEGVGDRTGQGRTEVSKRSQAIS